MLCQFCGKHHATNKFLVNFMGHNSEVFICDECLENFKQYTGVPQGQEMNMPGVRPVPSGMPAWPIGFTNGTAGSERKEGSGSFDVTGVSEIRTKRRLNQLHKQLKDAVNTENYEEAAILRDQINDIKNEVYINGK